jgi:signal transduction histidine kinase
MPGSEGRTAAPRRRAFQLPFRRELGLTYIATLCLLVGVEALWYHSVTQLEATVNMVDERGHPSARAAGTSVLPIDTATQQALNARRQQAGAAVTRTVAVTAVAFVLAFAITGLAVLRTEREMDRRSDAEQKAVEARDAAERMSRAKSDFLAHVSHELRTPLNSVIGFSNVLLRKSSVPATANDVVYLERIRDNGTHLLRVIDDLLDLSRIEAGKQQLEIGSVALDRLIAETTRELEGRQVGKAIVIRADLPPVVRPLTTDERKLKQVLINLIGNAIKFTESGTITVRVAVDPGTTEPIRIDVVDTGIGIPAVRLKAIFEPFEQADGSTARRHEGTGLGLSIARSFCDLMGYRLSVESIERVGSTFSIHLSRDTARTAVRTAEPVLASPGSS